MKRGWETSFRTSRKITKPSYRPERIVQFERHDTDMRIESSPFRFQSGQSCQVASPVRGGKPHRLSLSSAAPSDPDRTVAQRLAASDSSLSRETISPTRTVDMKLVFEQVFPIHRLPPEDSLLPSVMGGGDTDLLCGYCRFPVAASVTPRDLLRERLTCPRCGSRNELDIQRTRR
jgi:hypothetical protein